MNKEIATKMRDSAEVLRLQIYSTACVLSEYIQQQKDYIIAQDEQTNGWFSQDESSKPVIKELEKIEKIYNDLLFGFSIPSDLRQTAIFYGNLKDDE